VINNFLGAIWHHLLSYWRSLSFREKPLPQRYPAVLFEDPAIEVLHDVCFRRVE
jgi:hypothetical protein